MNTEPTSSGTVFSIMMSALAVGLAVGIPLGYVARYFDVSPVRIDLAAAQSEQR